MENVTKQYYLDNVYTNTHNQRDRELADIVRKYNDSLFTIEPEVLAGWLETYVQTLNQQHPRCKPLEVSFIGTMGSTTAHISAHVMGRSDMPVVSLALRVVKRIIESQEDL